MNTLPEWSIFVLGVVVAYLAMSFIARLKGFTAAGFGAFLAVIFSGVALTFAHDSIEQAGGEADDIWLYPIGVGAGLVVWTIIRFIAQLFFNSDQFFTDPLLGSAKMDERRRSQT